MSEGESATAEWYKLSVELHRYYGGKIEIIPKVPVRRLKDFAIWYTPGVAEASRLSSKNPDLSFELTSRWNTIAVVSDGTRVLGLGNIGPEGAYPVMEGKALIYKYLGGVDAVPLVHRGKDPEKFLELLELIEPSYGGINLEDIEHPKCFYILDEARKRLKIPVWHDDQQGTATITLAGLINALKIVKKSIKDVRIVLYGAGASNVAFYRLLKQLISNMENVVAITTKGILHPEMPNIDKLMISNKWQYDIAIETKGGGLPPNSTIDKAFENADVVIAASTPGPDTLKKEWISKMNKDAIVFALANPVPEIWPQDAKKAGAKIVATGRSDFPNQINNSLAFPAIFRGVLDVRAKTISDTMAITAAYEIAKFAEEKGLSENYIVPTMEEWEVYPRVAAAVAVKAVEEGVARKTTTYKEELQRAKDIISSIREKIGFLWDRGYIPKPLVDYKE
ncbi:malic enzyme [Caldisphaera lagunensis DSM 15908]|uniref:Malic enzyme n=1 Tax=Caldisphaera lagunensis (strain DSM 15908 / JCM 11604 / ANMR 0165 / IC-154) TaxID=1056495 RepID=L0AA78_CALLD|nr:NADP-dependent malic enzyme [Caldisphaera lagunensis]AFZ70027.1 malic enzyme [Caldisphaera lagunensis DSM 15908]